MRIKRSILVPCAVFVGLWVGLLAISKVLFRDDVVTHAIAASDQPATAPTDVEQPTIVDYIAIFEGMQESRDERALLERLQYGRTISANMRSSKIKALQDALEKLPADSTRHDELENQLDVTIKRADDLDKAEMDKFTRRQKQVMARLFGKIELAVGSVATKHGISAQPAKSPAVPTNLDAMSLEQLRTLLLKRSLPRSNGVPDNLSSEVLALLDSEYAAQKHPTAPSGETLTTTTGELLEQ